jgi:hypothetical protein
MEVDINGALHDQTACINAVLRKVEQAFEQLTEITGAQTEAIALLMRLTDHERLRVALLQDINPHVRDLITVVLKKEEVAP